MDRPASAWEVRLPDAYPVVCQLPVIVCNQAKPYDLLMLSFDVCRCRSPDGLRRKKESDVPALQLIGRIDASQFRPEGFNESITLSP